MRRSMSRRPFLSASAGMSVVAALDGHAIRSVGKDAVPVVLDHVLLGCRELQAGIDLVAQRTGVRAAFGGVHPGRGTQNALLSLGGRHYLEIIAPGPWESKEPRALTLRKLAEPRLVGWAAHPADIEALAQRLRQRGVAFAGPSAGSRKRPDGRVLNWKTLGLADNLDGLLPFFIEWGVGSVHPSVDAPAGCRMVRFEIVTPEPDKLAKAAEVLGIDVAITKGEKPELHATMAGPGGELSVRS